MGLKKETTSFGVRRNTLQQSQTVTNSIRLMSLRLNKLKIAKKNSLKVKTNNKK